MFGQTRRIWVCVNGTHCCQRQPDKVLAALKAEIERQGVSDQMEVIGDGCVGMCGYGPNAMVMIGRTRIPYAHVTPADAAEIVATHASGETKPIERLRLKRR